MAEVESFTRQLALNQDLSVLLNESVVDQKTNVYGIWKISRDIKAYSQTNDFLKHFYIYFTNFNVLVTLAMPIFDRNIIMRLRVTTIFH